MALSLCGTSVANTGELQCDPSRGVLRKIAIDLGYVDEDDYASEQLFHNRLVAKSKLPKSDSQKLFIINEAQDIADASEADKEGTLGLGFKAVLIEGRPAYKVKIFAGADLLKRLRTFNNQTIRIREYDANGKWWGTKSGTKSYGFQAKLFFKGNKIATGQNVEEGIVEMTISILSVSEYFDNCFYVETPSGANVEDIRGLLDVTLAYVSHVSNVLKYSMLISGSNLVSPYSIGVDYGALIAALTFTGKSGSGTPTTSLAITSIAYDATNDLLAVTYDNTAYGAATGNIKLIPPIPATLDAADVTNVELLAVTHAKPA